MIGPAICTVEGCGRQVTKPAHTLCLAHWKEAQLQKTPIRESKPAVLLKPKELGKYFGLSSTQINRVLAELGWIEQEGAKGWRPTAQGIKLCAEASVYKGNAFVSWPEGLFSSRILQHAVAVAKGEGGSSVQEPCLTVLSVQEPGSSAPFPSLAASFRGRFEANHWATDGHAVRSKAEMLIDNWLYYAGLVHAYERRLPVEEEAYCDFYLPQGKVYIEYWGLENDPKYAGRKEKKKEIYRAHEFRLIELNDEQIKNLDDVLPPLLLQYGISVD